MEQPTKKESEEGAIEKLVFGPEPVVAKDSQSAGIAAVMGREIKVDKARMSVIVRPFA